MSQRVFATSAEAEAAFYDAFQRGDLEAMMGVWAEGDDVVCIHPGGQRITGIAAVRESWRQILGASAGIAFHLSHQHYQASDRVAVHCLHENIAVPGEPGRHVVLATNVYRWIGTGWRMVVHHASPILAGPEPQAPGTRVMH